MLTIFNMQNDKEWIERLAKYYMEMRKTERTIEYIRSKTNGDVITFYMAILTFIGWMISDDHRLAYPVAFILLVLFVVILMPYRKKYSMQVNVIEYINHSEEKNSKYYYEKSQRKINK